MAFVDVRFEFDELGNLEKVSELNSSVIPTYERDGIVDQLERCLDDADFKHSFAALFQAPCTKFFVEMGSETSLILRYNDIV